jgi:hypothetical protein
MVSVSGVSSLATTLFDFNNLLKPPRIVSVLPLSGPVAGGTVVEIIGVQVHTRCEFGAKVVISSV